MASYGARVPWINDLIVAAQFAQMTPRFAQLALFRDVSVHGVVRSADLLQKRSTVQIHEISDGIIPRVLDHMSVYSKFPR